MAKGSQLSQLKSALSNAGFRGQPPQGKKRKRASAEEADKDKKAARLQDIHRKLNPFDEKVTKLKHEVIGRKLKGVSGRPAKSKQAGLEQRKKTLLKEHQEKNRAGGILDRRFGENDPTMTPEERMLERFTRERQRAPRADAFNLEDEEELTHYGQSLSKLDDFDGTGLGLEDDDDEEERGQIDASVVKQAHFGGFDEDDDDEPDRKKSKAEVMAEVIAKSKEHKAIRQQAREEDEDIRLELDNAFDSLKSLLGVPDPAGFEDPASRLEERDQQYDARVRELVFEQRAVPKDRTKTEEELALDRKAALEKAERRRKRRMEGLDDYDSEEEEERGRKKRRQERGGDDLEDDFEEPGILGAGLGEGEALTRNDDGIEDGSGEEDEEDESEDDEDDEVEEDSEMADGSDIEEHSPLQSSNARITGILKTKTAELPYTFPCPSSHEEFLDIVESIDDKDVPTVVQRIRTLYHPSLAEGNKIKLQQLAQVLMDHILYVSAPPSPSLSLVSALLPHLHALTIAYPTPVAKHAISKLVLMEKNLKRALALGPSHPDARVWPGVPELMLLRTIGALWPTSDMAHAVVSPARVLMGAYLGLGLPRVRTLHDVASGLVLCSLWLAYEKLSQRLVPEAVAFCANAVLRIAPHPWREPSDVPGMFSCPDLGTGMKIGKDKVKGLEGRASGAMALLVSDEEGDAQSKVDLLSLAVKLLGQFAELYRGLDGFIELYQPILQVLEGLHVQKLPSSIQTALASTQDTVTRLLKFSTQARRPLLLQAHKPIPIPSFVPKFAMSGSSYLRAQDPDAERVEASKLRRQVKEERKGALRELRKDARFLAGVQQREQQERDESYVKRMRQVHGSLEGERAEEKSALREKEKEKQRKRSGKR